MATLGNFWTGNLDPRLGALLSIGITLSGIGRGCVRRACGARGFPRPGRRCRAGGDRWTFPRAIRPRIGHCVVTSEIGFDLRTLPRDYGDLRAEARTCRSAAALFDFSFMHRIRIRGSEGHALVQTLTPRRIDDLAPGRIRYALRIGAGGQVLGDLTIWRLDSSTFEVFAGTAEPFAYLKAAASATTSVCDLSRETAIFAVGKAVQPARACRRDRDGAVAGSAVFRSRAGER